MTTILPNVRELLSTALGTEGQLLIPRKIADTLVQEVEKVLIPRSEAALFYGPSDIPGSSIDIDLATPNSMAVRQTAEGANITIDQEEYTSFNMKPVKFAVGLRITREMLEDAKWNLLDMNVRLAGKRLAENENSLVISDALDQAANTVAGGATVTIANITRAIQHLRDEDYTPTTYAIGNEVLNDLQNIDTFVEANKVGNTDMLQRGFLGTLYGMNVLLVSTNAGMTTTSSYVFDNTQAYVIAEKRAMTVEGFELPSNDMSAVSVTQRLKVRQLRAEAIAKITSS